MANSKNQRNQRNIVRFYIFFAYAICFFINELYFMIWYFRKNQECFDALDRQE